MSNDGLSTDEKVNLLFKNYMNFTSTLDSKAFFEETALANNTNIFSENIMSTLPPAVPTYAGINVSQLSSLLVDTGLTDVSVDAAWYSDKTDQGGSFKKDSANTVVRMEKIKLDYVANGGAGFICKDKAGENILQNIIPSNYAASGYSISLHYLIGGELKPVGWLTTRSQLAGQGFVGASVNFGGALFDSKNGIITFYDVNGDPTTVFASSSFYLTASKYVGPMGVTSSSTLAVAGDANFNNNVSIVGDLSAANIDISDNITTNTMTVTGTYSGNNMSINNVTAQTDSSFNSNLYIGGDLTVTNVDISDNITTGTMTVTGTYSGNDMSINNVTAQSDSSFNRNLYIGGDLSATNIDVSDNITTNTMTVIGTYSGNDMSINNVTAQTDSSFNSNLYIGGDLTATNIDVSDNITTGTLAVIGTYSGNDVSINNLSVQSDSSFNSDLYINGTTTTTALNVTSDGSVGGELTVNGDVSFNSGLTVLGKHVGTDVSINNYLSVHSDSSFNSDLYIGGDLIATNIQASTDITTATLTVTGNHTGNYVSINSLSVQTDSSFNADLYIGGDLSATNITGTLITADQSNITSVGALDSGSITSGFGNINIGTSTFSGDSATIGDTVINNVGMITTTTNDLVLQPKGSDSTVGTVTIKGELVVDGSINFTGEFIRTDTNVQITEQLDISNNGSGPALIARQHGTADIAAFYDDLSLAMIITGGSGNGGNVGIGTNAPVVKLAINSSDAIKIPVGTTAQRPSANTSTEHGYIRYNTELSSYEGFGAGDSWGSLGGIKDVDQDTYISAETAAGDDNDELKFVTAGTERMIIGATGSVGIGSATPVHELDLVGTLHATTKIFTTDLSADTLSIQSDSSFNANLYVGGDLYATNVQGTLTTSTQSNVTTMGNLVAVGDLNAGSITTGFGDIDIGTSTIVAGDISGSTITGIIQTISQPNVTTIGTLTQLEVTGDSSFNADLYVQGGLSVTNVQVETLIVTSTHIGNDVSINNLSVQSDSSFNSDLHIGGDLSVTNIQTSANFATNSLTVTNTHIGNDVSINNLSVQSDSSFNADLYIGGDLSVTNIQASTDIATVTMTVSGTHTGNDVNINNLSVQNDSSFNSDLYVGGDLSVTNNLVVDSEISAGSSITVGNSIITTDSIPNIDNSINVINNTVNDLSSNFTTRSRSAISNGTGISISDGIISIDQSVATNADPIFNNLTLSGNLTINGTTTTIDTTNLDVSDSLIGLSSGLTGTPANDAGILINRGDASNVFIGWIENEDKFAMGTTIATSTSNGDLTITPGTLIADLDGTASYVTNGVYTMGNQTISGEKTFSSQLNATDISAGNSITVGLTTITSTSTNLSGTPTAPTATNVTNNTQIATTEFVQNAITDNSTSSSGSSYVTEQPPSFVSIAKDKQSSYVDVSWVKFNETYKDAFTGRSYPIYLQTVVDISFTDIDSQSSNGWKTIKIGNGNYNTNGNETTSLETLRFTAASGRDYSNNTNYSLSFSGKTGTDNLPAFTQDDTFDLRVYAINNSGIAPTYIYIYNIGLKTTGSPSAVLITNTDTFIQTQFKLDVSFNLDSDDTSITSGIEVTDYDISYTLTDSKSNESVTHTGTFELDGYNNKNNLTFNGLKPGSKYALQLRAKNALNSGFGPYGDIFTATDFTNDGNEHRFINTNDLNSVSHNGMTITKNGSASINGKIVSNTSRSNRNIFSANNTNSKIIFSNASSFYINYGRQGTSFTNQGSPYVTATFDIEVSDSTIYSSSMDFTNTGSALTSSIGAPSNQFTFTSASSYTDEGKTSNYSKGFVYSSSISCSNNANTNAIFNANFPASTDKYLVKYTFVSQGANNTQRIDENGNTVSSRNSGNFYVDNYNGSPDILYTTNPIVSITANTYLFGIPSISNIQLSAVYTISDFASKYIPYGTISGSSNIHSKSNVSSSKNGYSFGTVTRTDISTTSDYSTNFTKNDSSISSGTYNANSTQSLLVTVNYLNNTGTPTVNTQTSTTNSNNMGKTFKDTSTSYSGAKLRFFNGSDTISSSDILTDDTSFATTYSSNISSALLYFNAKFVSGGYSNTYSGTSLSPFNNWSDGFAVSGDDYSSYVNTGSNGFKWIAIQVSRTGNSVNLSNFNIGSGSGTATRHDNHYGSGFGSTYRAYIYQDSKFGSLSSASNSGATSWFGSGPTNITSADSANGALHTDGYNAFVNSNGSTILYLIVGIDQDSDYYFTFS